MNVAISLSSFMIAYCVATGALNWIVYRTLRRRYQGVDLGKMAFEVAALLQFILWTPLALGVYAVDSLYLFAIPMARELYDFVLIWEVDRRGFTDHYRSFILGHHINSSLARLVLAAATLWLFSGDAVRVCFQYHLLYYCCSIFLVAPLAVERLLLDKNSPRARAISRTIFFILARVTHISVLPLIAAFAWKSLPAGPALGYSMLVALMVGFNEYHSVVSGLPLVRKAWNEV